MELYNSCLIATPINALTSGFFALNPCQARFQKSKEKFSSHAANGLMECSLGSPRANAKRCDSNRDSESSGLQSDFAPSTELGERPSTAQQA
jgi:hypothetical protein